jgi:hypothetical protein
MKKQSIKSDSIQILRIRCVEFLKRPIPDELRPHYAPNSIADMIVERFSVGDEIDSELLEIAEITIDDYNTAIANALSTDLKEYYIECQAILRAIAATSCP